MELKEFFKIFVIYKKLFWGIIVVCLVIGISFYFLQKESYKAVVSLDITRNRSVTVDEYSYDNFYRLQADEKFGDTVVAWIKLLIPGSDVYSDFEATKKINGQRMSAQVVSASFVTSTKGAAQDISEKLLTYLNGQSQKLNKQQNQDNWFMILGSEPVITDNTKSLVFLTLLSLFCGFFIAFWSVMIAHYIVDDK